MEDIERLQTRLANIRSARPILNALRTISLGRWQTALRHQRLVDGYRGELHRLLLSLRPLIAAPSAYPPGPALAGVLLIAVGTERGLCGRFSIDVLDHALVMHADYVAGGIDTRLIGLGAQIGRAAKRRKVDIEVQRLAASRLPTAEDAIEIVRPVLEDYEAGAFDAAFMVYGKATGSGGLQRTMQQIVPVPLDLHSSEMQDMADLPIVETSPYALYTQVLQQLAALTVHNVLLESAAAEYLTRFQLMDSATRNAERLTDELSMAMQDVTRQAITREVQTLAVSAGLVGGQTARKG
ncbi:MAG: F0F1 ATP synthase subunit gamma [Chloroflexi bacterium]|nr:F0F1 ATP synthase subunit gamma [Chloroflexota bacterium]